jgi:hypothetical protein
MPYQTRENLIAMAQRSPTKSSDFAGFAAPTSNTTYTPNQFFDVCLPNASRGCVRIVGYLIRKTLGWCDALGNPQHEQIEVSYRELERNAGISHGMIRSSLDEAVDKHFIECIRAGRARSESDMGETALYALKWDATQRYARTLDEFRGFYEGDGNRTDIPNQFFDLVIPNETLAVINVVGAVIRYSIGFQAKHGARRQQATLPYSQILKVSGLSSRRTLAGAILEAIAKHYIVRLDAGYFSASVAERRSAIYAVYWSDGFHSRITPKRIPADLWITHSEKDTSSQSHHSEKDISITLKRIPADHSEKDTIEIKQLNEKQKQRAEAAGLLKKQGFDEWTAKNLAGRYAPESIARQIRWLPQRGVSRNPMGLLRRAIENNWPAPVEKAAIGSSEPVATMPAGYLDWLKAELLNLARTAPEDHARFEAKRQRRRNDLNAEKLPLVRAQLLARHDSEVRRLMDFQTFLGLPGVREWAQEFNNQSNQTQS